jgi:hypothetical protein
VASEIQRWKIKVDDDNDVHIDTAKDGKYVLHSDHADRVRELEAEIAILKQTADMESSGLNTLAREREHARDQWIEAVIEQYPENWAFDPASPKAMVSNIIEPWKHNVRALEEALKLACMSHVATTDALTSDCYEAKANSKTQIELRTRAAKAAARLYDNLTTKAMLAKLAADAVKEAGR